MSFPIYSKTTESFVYDAGDNCLVDASSPDVKATFDSAGNILTIEVPSNVRLRSFRFNFFTNSITEYDPLNHPNEGNVNVVIKGGAGSGKHFNTNELTAWRPQLRLRYVIAQNQLLQPGQDASYFTQPVGDVLFPPFQNEGETTTIVTGIPLEFNQLMILIGDL